MPATISEFKISNQLRLTGIVSAQPLPRILYPEHNVYYQKIGVEISFQHDATIYKILKHHRQITLKEWIGNRISDWSEFFFPSKKKRTLFRYRSNRVIVNVFYRLFFYLCYMLYVICFPTTHRILFNPDIDYFDLF